MKKLLVIILVLSLFLISCQKEAKKEVIPLEEVSPEEKEIENYISEIEEVEKEINESEINDLVKELENI